MRSILDLPKEAVKLINKYLKINIKEIELEKYNSSFITINLKNREADIIYKLKEKNIFFLIEHQTKIDYSMPFRILEYQIEIIRSAINGNNINKKEYKIPLIIPIVLYTGKTKWNVETYIQNIQETLSEYKGIELGKFHLVDINDYSNDELLKEDTIFTKIMLAEKAKNKLDLLNIIKLSYNEINKKNNSKIYNKEQKDRYNSIMYEIVKNKIGNEEAKEFFENLKIKGGEGNMFAVYETIDNENRSYYEKGARQNTREITKKMLENKIDIKIIMNVTGLKEEEILKIKKLIKSKI